MRRPGPLPAPTERAEPSPPADPEGLAPFEDEPRRRGSLLPFRQRHAEPELGRESEPDPDASPVAGDAGERPTGWRDVWRASRARRRALRAEIRRFTARSRHRRMVWVVSLSALVLLVVGSVGAAYSPMFAVQNITVEGAATLDEAALQQALSAQMGRPLPLVDHSEVKAALVGFPLIETYTLEARPPHDLVLRIVERTPIGAVRSDAGFTVVDAAGVVLSTSEAEPAGLPIIEAKDGLTSSAFAAAGQVLRSLPETVHVLVASVKATTPDDVTLVLRDGTQVLWGSAEDSAKKSTVLLAAPDGYAFYDVSSPGAITVR